MNSLRLTQSSLSPFQEILQKVMQGRNEKQDESTMQSTRLLDERESSSGVQSTNSTSSSLNTSGIQMRVLNAALERVAQVKNEMLAEFDKLFGTRDGAMSATSGNSPVPAREMSLSEALSTMELVTKHGYGANALQIAEENFRLSQLGTNGNDTIFSLMQSRSISFELSSTLRDNSTGKEQSINIKLTMQESFIQTLRSSSSLDSKGVDPSEKLKLIDPLVIDYEGNGTELNDKSFSFDLDSDGTPDQISTLKRGSGFLALDKNNDGKINDGNELFGTKSGDGFADLASYDLNKDNKIDKNDAIFNKLRIWSPDENGNARLVTLGEAGIGAIYLNARKNEQIMQGLNSGILGIKRQSATFERTNGSKGEIHHIDFAKLDENRQGQTAAMRNHHLSAYASRSSESVQNESIKNRENVSEKELLDLRFNEMWQALERSLSLGNDFSLLNDKLFKGKLAELGASHIDTSHLGRAQSLLR
ncbi:MAG: hypothetical protein ACTTJS_04915 [Wolinella sp.]